MTRLSERIGQNIRRDRKAAHLTQQELASKAGVSIVHISRLERAQADQPRRAELDAVAAALGTTTDALMGIDDDDTPSLTEGDEPSDDELDAELAQRTSDPDVLLAFMARVRDPKKMSRQAKLVILEDLRKLDPARRRQG